MLRIRIVKILLTLFFIISSSVSWSQTTYKHTISPGKINKLSKQKTSDQENSSKQFITPQQMIDVISQAIEKAADRMKINQYPSASDNYLY